MSDEQLKAPKPDKSEILSDLCLHFGYATQDIGTPEWNDVFWNGMVQIHWPWCRLETGRRPDVRFLLELNPRVNIHVDGPFWPPESSPLPSSQRGWMISRRVLTPKVCVPTFQV